MSNCSKVLIVDDERHAREGLRSLLERYESFKVIDEAEDVDSALAVLNTQKPDVVFLDIQMPRKTGFELVEHLNTETKVVFVTAYDQYAIRAFEVNALDYLMKPVKSERLDKTVKRLISNGSNDQPENKNYDYSDRIFVKFNSSMLFISIKDIKFISADSDYTVINLTREREGLVTKTMNEWEMRLPLDHFVRIHRSTIVNLNYVSKIEKWFNGKMRLYIEGLNSPLTVSRSRAVQLKNKLG